VKRDESTLNRRRKILDEATKLFYEQGYQKASLRDIAAKVGITQAAIYYHFKNKEEILFNIIEEKSNNLIFLLKSSFSQKKDPLDNLKDAILEHSKTIRSSKSGAKIILEDKRHLSDDLKKHVRDKERIVFNMYKEYLEKLQHAGIVKKCDLGVAALSILGMINWLYHWYNPVKSLPIETIAEQITDNFFHGILVQ